MALPRPQAVDIWFGMLYNAYRRSGQRLLFDAAAERGGTHMTGFGSTLQARYLRRQPLSNHRGGGRLYSLAPAPSHLAPDIPARPPPRPVFHHPMEHHCALRQYRPRRAPNPKSRGSRKDDGEEVASKVKDENTLLPSPATAPDPRGPAGLSGKGGRSLAGEACHPLHQPRPSADPRFGRDPGKARAIMQDALAKLPLNYCTWAKLAQQRIAETTGGEQK